MSGILLPHAFFDRPADRVARELLGSWLVVRAVDGSLTRHLVCETEAYLGAHDLACHGRMGPTKRNATMFGPAGRWYVYLCYGMHWMLNIVTGRKGVPAAVLIRGVGDHLGPGRVTKRLGIDRSFDGRPASRRGGLWLEAGGIAVPRRLIERTPRIGVDYAGAWAEKPLRFVVDPVELSIIVGHAFPPGRAKPSAGREPSRKKGDHKHEPARTADPSRRSVHQHDESWSDGRSGG